MTLLHGHRQATDLFAQLHLRITSYNVCYTKLLRLDGAARALKSGRVRSIGAVVPTLDNAIFASAINALQRRLAQRDFTLLVASSDYDAAEELREARALLVRGVDGMVLVGSYNFV